MNLGRKEEKRRRRRRRRVLVDSVAESNGFSKDLACSQDKKYIYKETTKRVEKKKRKKESERKILLV